MTAGIKRICLIKQLRSGKNFSTRSKKHAKPAVIESIRCYAKQWKITLKGGETMGQTDSQFKAFLRFVLDALKDAETEQDEKKRTEKMKKILDNLQKSLED